MRFPGHPKTPGFYGAVPYAGIIRIRFIGYDLSRPIMGRHPNLNL
jgi:hypothetical protein